MEAKRKELDIGGNLMEIRTDDAVQHLRTIGEQLEDGGILSLWVRDLDSALEAYKRGEPNTEELIIGDGARSVWNREKLSRTLNYAGFEVIGGRSGLRWIEGGKIEVKAKKCGRPAPKTPMKEIHAVLSLPRICWTDTQGQLHQAAARLGFDVTRGTGVFWGQVLERMMEQVCRLDGVKYILTVDYDSIFDAEDIIRLWQVMETNPDVAALCPLQVGRDKDLCLLSVLAPDGSIAQRVDADAFHTDAMTVNTGHFGLTLIRVDAIRALPKPWFLGVPNRDGEWADGRVDDDIHFWYRMRDANLRVCVCPKVRIGHLQNIVTWPGEDLRTIHQYLTRFHDDGRPAECMTF